MSDELYGALIPVVIALLGLIGGYLRYASNKLSRKIEIMKSEMIDARKDISTTKEQVTNSHGTNLRDDIDSVRDMVTSRLDDVQDLLATIKREGDERAKSHIRSRELIEERLNSLCKQVESVRVNAYSEHERLWDTINKTRDKT